MRCVTLMLALALVQLAFSRERSPAPANASTAPALTSTAAARTVGNDGAGPTGPDAADLAKLAHRVVTTSLGIHEGDVVVVDGGVHTIPLMEQLSIEAEKAGGMPNIWLESAPVARAFMTDVPEKFLDQKPEYLADWYRHTTVYIGLSQFEDDKGSSATGVPPSHRAVYWNTPVKGPSEHDPAGRAPGGAWLRLHHRA